MRSFESHVLAFVLPMLLVSLPTSALRAEPARERPHAWRAPALPAPPADQRADDDDRLRPPLVGRPAPTDPRDGTTGRSEGFDPTVVAPSLSRALINGYEEDGGDDVLLGSLRYIDDTQLAVASNGDIYLALGLDPDTLFSERIEVYRSTDGGESFSLIGTFDSPGNDYDRLYELDVFEGNVDRVYVTYMHYNSARGGFDFRIAYADIPSASPTWQVRTVMNTPGVSFLGPDLASDVQAFGAFYLYAACAGLDGNGDDIWYSRSTDFGNTWSTPYRVASLSSNGNLMYSRPQIAYGTGGRLHLAYVYTERLQSTFDDGLRYTSANNYGNAAADWSTTTWALTSTSDGENVYVADLDTEVSTGLVAVLFHDVGPSSPKLFASYDGGASWNVANRHDVPMLRASEAVIDGSSTRLVVVGTIEGGVGTHDRAAYVSAPASNVGAWDTPKYFGEYSTWSGGRPSIAYDPTRSPGLFFAYTANTGAPDYQAAFDAQWRDGAGYPNYEDGFPLDLPSGGTGARTAPALADVDGDGDQEIVFGNVDGSIYVVHHDGTIADGWPVDVGTLGGRGTPVAVGDLNGDGVVEIVAGTIDGRVVALAPDGTMREGFPVSLGTAAPTFVSIGAAGPPYPRWIIALSGNRQARINWRGAVQFKSGFLAGTHNSPAAIGDVDNDGDAEIVYAFAPSSAPGGVHVLNADFTGGVQTYRSLADPVSDGVSLGDLDLDGDLEITIPTSAGKLYVVHHTGTDVAGFPYTASGGTPLTRVAIDQFLGTSAPELAFAERNWAVHVVYANGVAQTSFPASTGSGWFLFGAPIVTSVNSTSGNWVVIGSRDRSLWSFRNVGATQAAGWPKDVGDAIEVTPAAGDIDGDGRNEIVFLGNDRLHVIDVAVGRVAANEWWPMEGADAARTGCANCDEDVVTSVDGSVAATTRISLRIESENPSRGPVRLGFSLARPAGIALEVYDLRGRRVREIERSERGAGVHQLVFDGRDANGNRLARGSYVARLIVRDASGTRTTSRKFTWMD